MVVVVVTSKGMGDERTNSLIGAVRLLASSFYIVASLASLASLWLLMMLALRTVKPYEG
jgi:hypothetical protein